MNYDLRLTALNLAREITPPSDAETLIANALKIEAHLRGDTPAIGTDTVVETIVPDQVVPEATPGAPIPAVDPSGTAVDLRKMFDTGSTLVLRASQIGLTTFLAQYVADESRKPDAKILWFSATGRQTEGSRNLIASMGGDLSKVVFAKLNVEARQDAFDEFRDQKFSTVVVDGLGFLPYALETDFLASIMPTSSRFIFTGVPGQKRGLLYDLWKHTTAFQKAMLTWNMPLFDRSELATKAIGDVRETVGEARFRNQFECEFRENDPE